MVGPRDTALEVCTRVSLSGKVAVVTGASSGIGLETARALAHCGAHVFLAVRSVQAGHTAAKAITESTGNARVETLVLDLGSFSSIRACADTFLQRRLPLSILINNAGVMATPEREIAPCGYEAQFATNHLGHFLLTTLLSPALVAGAPSRVVSVSSAAHRRSGIRFDDINFDHSPYDKWLAYGQSKTANILFAIEYDRRMADKGVRAFSVHPGGIMTNLQKSLDPAEMKAMGWFDDEGNVNSAFKTTEQGASTSVFAATAPGLEAFGGAYLEDNAVSRTLTSESRDADAARRLWTISESAIG
jgi:NAD(P)-dependent dehydrogenase (short-subunit alcohol dehydrogenase family)